MTQAVIVSVARTPIGRAYKGAYNAIKSPTLLGHSIAHAVRRAGIAPDEIDDVAVGTVLAAGTAGMNLGRNAALAAADSQPWRRRFRIARQRIADHFEQQAASERGRLDELYSDVHAQRIAHAGALANQGVGAIVVDEILIAQG